jgi:hypothetical protein
MLHATVLPEFHLVPIHEVKICTIGKRPWHPAMMKANKKSTDEIKVFISSRDSKCGECQEDLGRGAWITLQEDGGTLCLTCADLDHLAFLPSGNAALTRRARKHSQLSAVVLKWSRARERYERQGLLVEEAALGRAEKECEADAGEREARRAREALRRAELDKEYITEFAAKVRELFPRCPKDREQVIARHACQKYSGRVGRSSAAKELSEDAIRLAVAAHVRHSETDYDELLMQGWDRVDARLKVHPKVSAVLESWQ